MVECTLCNERVREIQEHSQYGRVCATCRFEKNIRLGHTQWVDVHPYIRTILESGSPKQWGMPLCEIIHAYKRYPLSKINRACYDCLNNAYVVGGEEDYSNPPEAVRDAFVEVLRGMHEAASPKTWLQILSYFLP